MSDYAPSSLPLIDTVEIVILRGLYPDRVDLYMKVEAAPSVTIGGDGAQRIADLWRTLPPGEQSRCHIPPFGLRFRSGDGVVCEASVC